MHRQMAKNEGQLLDSKKAKMEKKNNIKLTCKNISTQEYTGGIRRT